MPTHGHLVFHGQRWQQLCTSLVYEDHRHCFGFLHSPACPMAMHMIEHVCRDGIGSVDSATVWHCSPSLKKLCAGLQAQLSESTDRTTSHQFAETGLFHFALFCRVLLELVENCASCAEGRLSCVVQGFGELAFMQQTCKMPHQDLLSPSRFEACFSEAVWLRFVQAVRRA